MFFILEGTGQLRLGSEEYPVRVGDVICCPAGDSEMAHQFVNDSNANLKFLAVSTKHSPEIVDYPDSGKFGILADYPSGPDGKPKSFMFVGFPDRSEEYWEGN